VSTLDEKLEAMMAESLDGIDPAVARIGLDAIIGFVKGLAAGDPPLVITNATRLSYLEQITALANSFLTTRDREGKFFAETDLRELVTAFYETYG
jgi:hypothetical protein